jgi:cytochrome c5
VTHLIDSDVSFCFMKLVTAVRNALFPNSQIRAMEPAAALNDRFAFVHMEGAAMTRLRRALSGFLFLAALPLVGLADGAPRQANDQPPPKAVQAANTDRGQQVFEQNCSRCHNAPEGFSPRISGTIARHMRVRAGLSDADYKALRRFLNP